MAVPTVADVDAPLTMLVTSGWGGRARTSTDLEYQYQCLDLRDETRIEVNYSGLRSKEATGKLDSVALNLGDISRLRVDATIFGTTPCLKVIGGGRGFVGCSSIIAGAGPMLPFFVSQQRDFLLKAGSDTSGEDNVATTWKSADVAVAALRKGIARLTTLSSQSLLQAPLSADNNIEEVSNLPFAALSAVAASAGRRCLTSGHLDEPNSLQARDESEARVFPPTSLWPSGSIMLSPGFSLPSFFLVHVVEPNAIYSNEHFFCALSRLEELQTAQKRNGERQTFKESSPNEWSDWKAINNPAEKHLHRCCWKRMQLLENCYVEALNAAAALGVRSVATPCLGTGIGGFPTYIAARCAAKAVAWWMRTRGRKHCGHEAPLPGGDSHSLIERVIFCTTSDREWKALRYLIPAYFA